MSTDMLRYFLQFLFFSCVSFCFVSVLLSFLLSFILFLVCLMENGVLKAMLCFTFYDFFSLIE